jgi:hypothetical protein
MIEARTSSPRSPGYPTPARRSDSSCRLITTPTEGAVPRAPPGFRHLAGSAPSRGAPPQYDHHRLRLLAARAPRFPKPARCAPAVPMRSPRAPRPGTVKETWPTTKKKPKVGGLCTVAGPRVHHRPYTPNLRIQMRKPTVPDLRISHGQEKGKTAGQRLDLRFTMEPPKGIEPLTYALRDQQRSC